MAEAIVSVALELLNSIVLPTASFIGEQVRLVGDIDEEVEKLKNNLQAIKAVLRDADQKQMKNEAVRVWLNRLKDACYDVEDVLDEWSTEIMKLKIEGGYVHNALAPKKKVCCFSPSPCFGFKEVVLRRDIAVRIKKINKKLDAIAKEKGDYNLNVIPANERPDYQPMQTTSFIDVSDICGRDSEKNNLVRKLLCESSEQRLQIISLVGMGGIGKTTLAQYVYNNEDVKSNFNSIVWVCVSDPFDEFKIARVIIEALKVPPPNVQDLQSLLQRIHDSIAGKKFLLILDDVWNEDYNKWEPFYHCLKNGLHGSKILITTRKESVVRIMKSIDIINVEELSFDENWLLFRRLALSERPTHECEQLEEIGREIVKKCKGLPLATKTIGSFLQFKRSRDEWQRVLCSEMWKLEEIEKGLLSPLMLSYNDLQSSIRKCFSYCAIFPKDYKIIKVELIQLWMAQGYLGLEKDTKLETIGEEYFHHLATRSFFQEFSKYDEDVIWGCKMHDIVHDFALFLSNGECVAKEVNIGDNDPFINSSDKDVRHLMLKVNKRVPFPMSIWSVKNLRSLIIFYDDIGDNVGSGDVLQNLCKLTCLRSLIFPRGVEEIPKDIKKLVHLRYLDLSEGNIVRLPESLCELYNLHTLNISRCYCIVELPQGIEKLVNLRQLINDRTYSLLYIPKGIEKLTGLQTLSEFVISSEGDNDNKACSLEGLKNLNNLEGSLTIRGLGFVKIVSDGKIKQLLTNKENLTSLTLYFYKFKILGWRSYSPIYPGEEVSCEDYELVLKALLPPPKLKRLKIEYYRGYTFPSTWITSLTNLKSLSLQEACNCKNLHPLGKLPSLVRLEIANMENVKKVDNVFWGMESGTSLSSSSSYFFPKLEKLEFSGMYEWEEWDNDNAKKGEDKEHTEFMPCLATLRIGYCNKLKALPDSLLQRTTLKELSIYHCDILRERYKEGTGEDWHKISHIPNIRIDGNWVKRAEQQTSSR